MQHWIIDRESRVLANFQQAMPQAHFVARDAQHDIPGEPSGIRWYRLRSGEPLDEIVRLRGLGTAQRAVVICDEPNESLVMQALAAGAAGCCNTHAAPEVLSQVALVVQNGGLWIGQSLLQRLVGGAAQRLEQRGEVGQEDWAAQLTEREAQVARKVAEGASNKEVAQVLSITERTVKAHLTTIFEKLGLRDRLQLSLKINGLKL